MSYVLTYSISLSLCLGQKSFKISKGRIGFPDQQWMKVGPRCFDDENTSVWGGPYTSYYTMKPSKGRPLSFLVNNKIKKRP